MRNPLYRSRNGIVFGICRGVANHFDLSAFWLRLGLIVGVLLTGLLFSPLLILYVALALIIKLEPVIRPSSDNEQEFYQSYTSSGSLSLSRLKDKFDSLEQRARRIENHVTNKAYDWDRRFSQG